MIRYDAGSTYLIIFIWVGSVYWKAFKRTLPAVVIAAGVIVVREMDDTNALQFGAFKNQWAYSVFTFLLGFTLVFRCNMAYQRFWSGRGALERMTNQWTDAAIKCVSFDKRAKLPEENRRVWRSKIISMFSLLHAAALGELSERTEELEVINGIDEQAVNQMNLDQVTDDVYLAYAWIQDELMVRISQGGLSVPPPIATRIWQDLTNGMQGYNDAHIILDTPFPFPYAQILAVLLALLTVSCGYVMATFVASAFWVIFLTATAVATYHGLNEVAKELEMPFGTDPNDLPITEYQLLLNDRLQQLLFMGERQYQIPTPSSAATAMAQQYKKGPEPVTAMVQHGSVKRSAGACFGSANTVGTANTSPESPQPNVALARRVYDGLPMRAEKLKVKWAQHLTLD